LRPEEEIKEIFGHLKNLIIANQEIGMDPPAISNESIKYLKADTTDTGDNTDQPDHKKSLDALREHIGNCRRCKLYKGRTSLVFGEGSPYARLVFVGEGPGRDEDIAGKPFVGKAGKMLTRIIENGMGLSRKDVYICNVVKCHPPGNRDPERDEIEACLPFLKKQLAIIMPEVICILGRVAGQALLGGRFKISLERGKWRSFMNIPVMPTFHPAYVLRNPTRDHQLRSQIWEDIKKIMKRLDLEVGK